MYSGRIVEIDAFRGIAIMLMIIFHTVFDLAYFYNWTVDYLNGFWYYQGKFAAILFMLVSGLSSSLSKNPLRRGLMIMGAGLAITAITYIFNPAVYIRFGILHLLGAGMLLAPLLVRLTPLPLMLTGSLLLVSGKFVTPAAVTTSMLIPLGLPPSDFASLDYYPLIPWLGFVVYGLAAGKLLYPTRQPRWPNSGQNSTINLLAWLGRRSLFIYLMHQPILLTVLYSIHTFLF